MFVVFQKIYSWNQNNLKTASTGSSITPNHFFFAFSLIAFVDFERGKTTAWIRFKNENAAKDLAEKLNEKYKDDEKLKVKENEIVFKVLEGDEEKEYLEKAAADIKSRKQNHKKGGHKRRHGGGRGGGRGGRGGKRGRYWKKCG